MYSGWSVGDIGYMYSWWSVGGPRCMYSGWSVGNPVYMYSGCSVGHSGQHQDVCTVALVCWTSRMCVQWVESPSHAWCMEDLIFRTYKVNIIFPVI